ncbi:glycosyl transferase family 90 [Roseomonas sp. CAU 1739]|uniref:glycosyl transferase family 90 n=1 Tax=Roseomonas sp. CAU 1739 TaxID=3140364 RepID=UPI00325BE0DB
MEILENRQPGLDAIRASDLAFHFGELIEGPIFDPRDFRGDPTRLDANLVGVVKGQPGLLLGREFAGKVDHGEGRLRSVEAKPVAMTERLVNIANRALGLVSDGTAMLLSMNDARSVDWTRQLRAQRPVAVFQHNRRIDRQAVIVPLLTHHTYPSPSIPMLDDRTALRDKASRIVWRGTLRGTRPFDADYRFLMRVLREDHLPEAEAVALLAKFPRFALTMATRQADFCDIGYVRSPDVAAAAARYPILEAGFRAPMRAAEQIASRYILALDGNDWASNVYWAFNSNSLVIREASPWQAYGDNYFRPWVHFVPFDGGVADLADKFAWCETHLPEAERMVANARAAWALLFDPTLHPARIRMVHEHYDTLFRRSIGG